MTAAGSSAPVGSIVAWYCRFGKAGQPAPAKRPQLHSARGAQPGRHGCRIRRDRNHHERYASRRPAARNGDISNGNREGSNNFLYDGIDDNERLTLSIVLRPAVEAVREFKIQTNLYSADVGRNSGAVVDVITKSGTNKLHGSLFEFLRNSAMDARNFFSPKGTLSRRSA